MDEHDGVGTEVPDFEKDDDRQLALIEHEGAEELASLGWVFPHEGNDAG